MNRIEALQKLYERHNAITDHFDGDKKVVLLDFAIHQNVGDLLINEGELAFFFGNSFDVRGIFSFHDLFFARKGQFYVSRGMKSLNRKLEDGASIVIHGGGNLGDLYPENLHLFKFILENYKKAKVFIMPQSVFFVDKGEKARLRKKVDDHGNVVFFARDKNSSSLFEDIPGATTILTPDSAHQLINSELLNISPTNSHNLLYFLRQDKERRAGYITPADSRDWQDILNYPDMVFEWSFRQFVKQTAGQSLDFKYNIWKQHQRKLIKRAISLINQFDVIETDRLHVAILAVLLNKVVRIRDNQYGKLTGYFGTWFEGDDRIEFV